MRITRNIGLGALSQRRGKAGRAWLGIAVVATLLTTMTETPANAHQVGISWHEDGDAGELRETAQRVVGLGPLMEIGGSTNHADMFKICVSGNRTFSATTVQGASWDTQLFLFDASGRGVYAHDDVLEGFRKDDPLQPIKNRQSELPAGPRTDPDTGESPRVRGEYFLAISPYDYDPARLGQQMFDEDPPSWVHGPVNGSWIHDGWTGGVIAGGGQYQIRLTGAEFLSPSTRRCQPQ